MNLKHLPDISKNRYALYPAVLAGVLMTSWIIDNSGLRSDPDGWLESARLLAKLCVGFSSFQFAFFLSDQALKRWNNFREKQL